MPQYVEFNDVLKSNRKENFEVGKHYWIAKGGYKAFPMQQSIDLLDVDAKFIGKARVKVVEIKFQELMSDEDAKRIGFTNFYQLGYFLEMDNPAEGQLVTFIYFERIE